MISIQTAYTTTATLPPTATSHTVVKVKGSTCSGLDTPAAISAQPGQQEGQHPLTGQCAANFRLLANQ